jgi:TetR/AcrR family transcriptional regulator
LFPTKADVHGIKRQEVLREAAASFNFKGYHATSLTEIATSLGVTKAALYHYFPNKNSLLAACFEQAMDVAFASLERGRKQGSNGRDRLMLTISGYVSQLIDELNCCVVLMEEQALEPGDRAKLVRQRDRFERSLRALVRDRGRQRGAVRSQACDLRHSRRHELGAEMVQAERRVDSGAADGRAQPDL